MSKAEEEAEIKNIVEGLESIMKDKINQRSRINYEITHLKESIKLVYQSHQEVLTILKDK